MYTHQYNYRYILHISYSVPLTHIILHTHITHVFFHIHITHIHLTQILFHPHIHITHILFQPHNVSNIFHCTHTYSIPHVCTTHTLLHPPCCHSYHVWVCACVYVCMFMFVCVCTLTSSYLAIILILIFLKHNLLFRDQFFELNQSVAFYALQLQTCQEKTKTKNNFFKKEKKGLVGWSKIGWICVYIFWNKSFGVRSTLGGIYIYILEFNKIIKPFVLAYM